ncbi:hypothetical protein Hanom_Chr14g01292241 [Helianthus anomalus]
MERQKTYINSIGILVSLKSEHITEFGYNASCQQVFSYNHVKRTTYIQKHKFSLVFLALFYYFIIFDIKWSCDVPSRAALSLSRARAQRFV